MTNKKKGLGRGLTALFGDQKSIPEKTNKSLAKSKANTGDLVPNKYQPRINFNEEKLQELTGVSQKKRYNSTNSS